MDVTHCTVIATYSAYHTFWLKMCYIHAQDSTLAKNPVFHARTKRIGLRYHFIRSVLENGVLKLDKILGYRNPADMFTKVVNKEKLKLCSTSVNLQSE
ncbi:hypothetical protein LIER_16483 [Lithospermum erythrorhizon]|uniref:Uncharacterized protein n=1 Tax=Lithospermum erythrorhizon TaxID=34254 RepID=A0AAV3Q6U8_LITER